ncbi:sensor histidine kinase [Actinomadura roseirufa]|uniref:sensor histidine kinase n=1 Tax=Actinomadura roseirufa TaxID=2094049 RepID=UPI00104177E4|nr:sensor histidine kinase [Actinomadura roseirufa]
MSGIAASRRVSVRAVLAWAAAFAFPCLLFVVLMDGRSGTGVGWGVLPAAFALMAVPALLLRRRAGPSLVLLVLGWAALGASVLTWEIGYLKVLVDDTTVGMLAAARRRRVAVGAAGTALAVHLACSAFYLHGPDAQVRSMAFAVLALVAAFLTGNSVRERRAHAAALRERATVQAVTAERLRIARELHDMVAHSIGIIAIQAGVGGRVIDTQPAEARKALHAIEETSRETLSGLRRMLGALRRTDGDPAPLDPAPGLADLERLAASALDAGVRVDVRWRGERRPLPAEVDLSAFRIVQEAVTNVVRHADAAECRVTVGYGAGELSVEVVDEGRGGAVGAGYGLVGMRERVGLLRGQFTAGPRPEGGFRVAARIPT